MTDTAATTHRNADGSYQILGRTVTMPVRVRSARMAACTFVVDPDAAQGVIDGTGLTVRRRGRFAMVSLALVRYVDCDLGDYNELGLAFIVEDPPGAPKGPRGSVATYIHRLPVNQEFTCAAGRGIWGFPKWVADLDLTIGADGARAVLRDDGRELVRVEARRGLVPMPSRPLEMRCYSNRPDDGGLLRTAWTTDNRGVKVRARGATVTVGDGHPFCDDLRALGIDRRRPLMTMTASQMRATFSAPEAIISR